MFGLITKVHFTALCALLSVFSLNRLFWGDLTVQTTLAKQTKITGK